MKKVFFLLVVLGVFSCGEPTVTQDVQVDEVKYTKSMHGDKISEDGALASNDFMSLFSEADSVNGKLTATITDVCAKKGCWMTLDLGNEQEMHVTFKDYGFFVPKDAAGKTAIIEGYAKLDTIDVATLKHYAEDAEATQEEIDAITEPEITYSFEANGVIIKSEEVVK